MGRLLDLGQDGDFEALDQPSTTTIENPNYAKFMLLEGNYAFLTGPGGDQPGVPPQSIAVLEVLP